MLTNSEPDLDRKRRTLASLQAKGNTTFRIGEIAHLAGLSPGDIAHAHVLAHRLTKEGKLVRVDRGLYALPDRPVPTMHRLYWRANAEHFQLSHRSAMAMHGFGPPLPHAELVVTVDASKRHRPLDEHMQLRFVKRHPSVHGEPLMMEVPQIGRVPVADAETTLVEGLFAPELCGGLLEVCGFLASRHGQWDGEGLVARAHRFGTEALIRRLGLLLELSGDPAASALQPLVPAQDASVAQLDPQGARRGELDRRWRLRMNLPREDVLHALGIRPGESCAV